MRIIGAAAVPPPLGFCADRVPGHLSKKQKNSTDLLIENRKKYTPPQRPPQQRQRKETQKQIRVVFSFAEVGTVGFHRAKKSPVGRLFLFWTVNGPFSLFLCQEKEKMGGGQTYQLWE